MNISFGPTFESIHRLRQWLNENELIADRNVPLFEWVDGESMDSTKCPSKGVLLLNSDCSPSGKDCIDMINSALTILKDRQITIEEIQYCSCDKGDDFFFAKLGVAENEHLIIKHNTLEELKHMTFNIEVKYVVEDEKKERQYKLLVTVNEVKELSYDLKIPQTVDLDLNDIKDEIVSMLSNYSNVNPKTSTLIDHQVNKRVLILQEVLCTKFMKAFLQKAGNYYINPFAEEMKKCLRLDKINDDDSSMSKFSPKELLDFVESKDKEFKVLLKIQGKKEKPFDVDDDIWLVRMSTYLGLLSQQIYKIKQERSNTNALQIKDIIRQLKEKEEIIPVAEVEKIDIKTFISAGINWPENTDQNRIHSNRVEKYISDVLWFIKTSGNDFKDNLEDITNTIYWKRCGGKGLKAAINKDKLCSILKTLKTFIVDNEDLWDKYLKYKMITSNRAMSIARYTVNSYIVGIDQSPDILFKNASYIEESLK